MQTITNTLKSIFSSSDLHFLEHAKNSPLFRKIFHVDRTSGTFFMGSEAPKHFLGPQGTMNTPHSRFAPVYITKGVHDALSRYALVLCDQKGSDKTLLNVCNMINAVQTELAKRISTLKPALMVDNSITFFFESPTGDGCMLDATILPSEKVEFGMISISLYQEK